MKFIFISWYHDGANPTIKMIDVRNEGWQKLIHFVRETEAQVLVVIDMERMEKIYDSRERLVIDG